MPTYEYRCQQCATEFEIRQSFADDPLTGCIEESCGGTVNKVFRGVGISFKGDGFYKNDHGSSSKAQRPSADSSTSTTGSSSDSSDSSNGSSDQSGTTTEKAPVAASTSGSDSTSSD